jgi:hypothetical protein
MAPPRKPTTSTHAKSSAASFLKDKTNTVKLVNASASTKSRSRIPQNKPSIPTTLSSEISPTPQGDSQEFIPVISTKLFSEFSGQIADSFLFLGKLAKERCKRCGLGHGHKECPSPPEKASCTNCKGEHPSSYSGCPSYKEAILSKKQKETTTAQKIAPPANILDATRIAATLAQVLTEILLTPHQEVTQDMILLKIAKSVSVMFKVNMTPSLISSIY